jgi:homoserine O-succinyltransferase
MPVFLDRHLSAYDRPAKVNSPRGMSPLEFRESEAKCIDIGLINNMPSAALEATERQFRTQLDAAADGILVRLTLYALPDVPRTDWGQRRVTSFYSDIRELWDSHLDALIVTGTEPRSSDLMDEPYWEGLTGLVEWAEHHTHSAVWSCLAAHAAVLHVDGIKRHRLLNKRFGVFECERISNHHLTASAPARLQMPHSRWNELPEDALVTCGYRVLTRSQDAGVDTFVKQRKSLSLFFQGHPEYEADTLLREYRRDIGRFLRQETDSYPSMPQGYFDEDTVDALTALRQQALSDRRPELLADFPIAIVAGKVRSTWRSAAVGVYRNWLLYLCAKKELRLRARQGPRGFQRVRAATFSSPRGDCARQVPEIGHTAREVHGDA